MSADLQVFLGALQPRLRRYFRVRPDVVVKVTALVRADITPTYLAERLSARIERHPDPWPIMLHRLNTMYDEHIEDGN